MSLLEDIFLQDEANEARELERIIEGEEIEERAQSDSDNNSEKEGEAEEDKRKVDPGTTKAKRVVRNPRFVLNPARLTGPRGIQVIPEHFKDFKFKGKGHEKEDLDLILKKLEHWAYRLYPKFQFEDCLKKIETLGKKRPVMVHLKKIRSDQFLSDETVVQKDSSDEDAPPAEPEEDEFDRLLQQQIELARATPAPNSAKKPPPTQSPIENRLVTIPKATSSPSINKEQRERMLRSRRLAEERRLARLKISTTELTQSVNNVAVEDKDEIEMGTGKPRRQNKSNVIDSSDDEDTGVVVNESITVDIHSNNHEVDLIIDSENNQDIENTEDLNSIRDVSEDNEDIEKNKSLSKTKDIVVHSLKIISNTNAHIENGNIMSIEESNHKNDQEIEESDVNTVKDVEINNIEQDDIVSQETDDNIKDPKENGNVIGVDRNSNKEHISAKVCEEMDIDFSEEF